MTEVVVEMGLEEVNRLRVAQIFLSGYARVWWDRIRASYTTLITWETFVMEFHAQYYSRHYRDQRRGEFLNLTQGSRTVRAYDVDGESSSSYGARAS